MPTPNQWLRIMQLTSTHRELSLTGKAVVVILDNAMSKVLGHNSADRLSQVVRVQLGGRVVLVYATVGLAMAGGGTFDGLTTSGQYWVVIYNNGNQSAYGPMYFSYGKPKTRRQITDKKAEVDTKTGGSDVLVFTDVSARQLLAAAKDVGNFHKRRGFGL